MKKLLLVLALSFGAFSTSYAELVFQDGEPKQEQAQKVAKTKKEAKKSTTKKKQSSESGNSSAFECGTKRYCKEMKSCAEAKFHLQQCGLKKLDRDGDGRPCENVCG